MLKKEDVFKIGQFAKPHGIKGEISFAFDNDIFDKADFIKKTDMFIKIRNHIAHNRIVSCEAISKLEDIEMWLLKSIGQFSAS